MTSRATRWFHNPPELYISNINVVGGANINSLNFLSYRNFDVAKADLMLELRQPFVLQWMKISTEMRKNQTEHLLFPSTNCSRVSSRRYWDSRIYIANVNIDFNKNGCSSSRSFIEEGKSWEFFVAENINKVWIVHCSPFFSFSLSRTTHTTP